MATKRPSLLPTMVWRSLMNNARISAWMLVTLATCAALVTLFTTLSFEVRKKMSQTLRSLGANAVAYAEAQRPADWAAFERVTQDLNTNAVRLNARVGLVKETAVAIVSADPQRLEALTPYWAVTGRRAAAASECLVGRHVAEVLKLKPGEAVKIAWANGEPPSSLLIVGQVATGDEDDERIFVTPGLQRGSFTYALLSVTGGEPALAQLQQALNAAHTGVQLKPLRQIFHGEEHVLDKVRILCLAALGAVLVLTALGVTASMLARVVERRKEFALLQAIGAHPRSVVKFLLAESAAIGGVAALAGYVAGTLLAVLVVRHIFNVSVMPHGLAFVAALGVTISVTLLAGGLACRRMLRFEPAAALKGE